VLRKLINNININVEQMQNNYFYNYTPYRGVISIGDSNKLGLAILHTIR